MPLPILAAIALQQGVRYGARKLAAYGGRKILGLAGRKISKQAGKMVDKYGNTVLHGYFIIDAVNEAQKGNTAGLDLMSLGKIPGAGKVLSRLPGLGRKTELGKKLEKGYEKYGGGIQTIGKMGSPGMGVDTYIAADDALLRNVTYNKPHKGGIKWNIPSKSFVTRAVIKDKKGSSPVFDAGKNPKTKNIAKENTAKFYYSDKGEKLPFRVAVKKGKILQNKRVYHPESKTITQKKVDDKWVTIDPYKVKEGDKTRTQRIRKEQQGPFIKEVFLDKEGKIATYLPASYMRQGSSEVKGWTLIDGKLTRKSKTHYTDPKITRAEQTNIKKRELGEGYLKLETKKFDTKIDKVDRTKAHLDYETKQITDLFAKEVKAAKEKGDKVNRLFFSSKDQGSVRAAAIYMDEARKIGLHVKPITTPSKGAVKNVKIHDVVKDKQYGSDKMQNTLSPNTTNVWWGDLAMPKFLNKPPIYLRDDRTYVFADNVRKQGQGPKSGQAVIRGHKTAHGIPSKESPREFWNDKNYARNIEHIDEAIAKIPRDKPIVISSGGIGTGHANLEKTAPKTFAYLQESLKKAGLHPEKLGPNVTKVKEFPKNYKDEFASQYKPNYPIDNRELSNLAYRPFTYKGKKYETVEHAYQTLKSGEFHEATYLKQWGEGVKIRGKGVKKLPMVYKHGEHGQMRDDLVKKGINTTSAAVKAGVRTQTTRANVNQYKVGETLDVDGARVTITNISKKTLGQELKEGSITKAQWSKAEGWDQSYITQNPKVLEHYRMTFTKKDKSDNIKLMEDLMTESFKQNPQAMDALKATGGNTLTHFQDKTIWGKEFPKILTKTEGKPNLSTKTF